VTLLLLLRPHGTSASVPTTKGYAAASSAPGFGTRSSNAAANSAKASNA
jgi:hypothetical protein